VRMVCDVGVRFQKPAPYPSWASISSSRSRRHRGRQVAPSPGKSCRHAHRRCPGRTRGRLARCRCRRSRAVNRPATSVRFWTSKNAPRSIPLGRARSTRSPPKPTMIAHCGLGGSLCSYRPLQSLAKQQAATARAAPLPWSSPEAGLGALPKIALRCLLHAAIRSG
jgi:hypothetical protein